MVFSADAACTVCTSFEPGTNWGTVLNNNIREASGIAASARNPGVLWTHNDGPRSRIYALSTNGAALATYSFTQPVDDFEDIVVGGGYIWIGDLGGSQSLTGTRSEIRILRVPEPAVSLDWAMNPVTADLGQVEVFTLTYPDGSYDAETIWFDPPSNTVYVVTKESTRARVYQVNFAASGLDFVTSIGFPLASGGDISSGGSQIALRREDAAVVWGRCAGESITDALARDPVVLPVIGAPTEPNGEGIGFLRDGTGYVTISEGQNPILYYFQSTCSAPPQFSVPLSDQTTLLGGTARFNVGVGGYPPPVFEWRFKGQLLTNETNSFLVISNVGPGDVGLYEVTASNVNGLASSTATLEVITKPDLRITEVMSAPTSTAGVSTADWWELTSFESQPVSLSGWRFNDNGGALTDPFVIPPGVTIRPGESMIFVEGVSEGQFRAWWGVSTNVQIVTYAGNGLGLGANGDGLRLWNSFTTDPADTVTSVNFGPATTGVTFNCDPITGQFGPLSQLGVNGVFRAAAAGDIGSPGRIIAPAGSPALEVSREDASVRIVFDTIAGHRYSLEVKEENGWSPTGDTHSAASSGRASFLKTIGAAYQFFRVVVD